MILILSESLRRSLEEIRPMFCSTFCYTVKFKWKVKIITYAAASFLCTLEGKFTLLTGKNR